MDERDNSTRKQVMRLLREQGALTAKDIAHLLGITSVGVRRHLSVLEREGLAQARIVRRKMGRPALEYTLTDQANELFPRNYDLIANQILDAVSTIQGDRGVDSIFSARMDQLLQQYLPRMRGKELPERVKELARIQEEAGYMATVEETKDGYLLLEGNCAIYRVACRFQHACHFEIELFRRLLGVPVTRVEHQMQGDRRCAYLVHTSPVPKMSRAKYKPGTKTTA